MKKSKPSTEMYAIVVGFVLITVLQLIHAVMALSKIKNASATEQMQKVIKNVDKPDLLIPGAAIRLTGGR